MLLVRIHPVWNCSWQSVGEDPWAAYPQMVSRSVWYPMEAFLFRVHLQNLASRLQFGCSKYYTCPQGLILCVWCDCGIWFHILYENSKCTFSLLNTSTSTKCLYLQLSLLAALPLVTCFWFCCFFFLQMLLLEGSLASFLLIFATDSTTPLWVTQPVTNLMSACWIRTLWRKKRELQQTMQLGCLWRELLKVPYDFGKCAEWTFSLLTFPPNWSLNSGSYCAFFFLLFLSFL